MIMPRTHSEPSQSLYAATMAKRIMLGVQDFRLALRARMNAASQGEHTVLAHRGRPVAVLVPMEWYRAAAAAMGDPTEY